MSSSLSRHLAWIAGGILSAVAALSVVAARGVSTPVDRAIPLYVLLLFALGWMVRESVVSSVIAAFAPLLVIVAVAVPSPSGRAALVGLTLAAAVAATTATVSTGFRVRLGEAIGILAVAVTPMRLIPFDWLAAIEFVGIAAGAVILAATLSRDGRISILRLALIFGLVAATPFEPARASLFVLLVAMAATIMRGATLPKLAGAALVALAAGRWSWPIALVPLVAAALASAVGERGAPMFVLPPFVGRATALMRAFAFIPAAGRQAYSGEPARVVASLVLIVLTFFVRGPIGVLYALAAATILAGGEEDDSPAWAVPTLAIAFVMLCIAGWGAVPSAIFPLPADATRLLAVSLLCVAGGFLARWRIAGVVAAAMFVTFALPGAARHRDVQLFERALGAGESTSFHLGQPRPGVEVTLSGANVSGLLPQHRLATIEALDDRGRGYRREVSVAEAADWAAFRADQAFFTRNVLPSESAGRVVGWGSGAFFTGAGRIPISLPRPVSLVRITADSSLPKGSVVQLHSIEGIR